MVVNDCKRKGQQRLAKVDARAREHEISCVEEHSVVNASKERCSVTSSVRCSLPNVCVASCRVQNRGATVIRNACKCNHSHHNTIHAEPTDGIVERQGDNVHITVVDSRVGPPQFALNAVTACVEERRGCVWLSSSGVDVNTKGNDTTSCSADRLGKQKPRRIRWEGHACFKPSLTSCKRVNVLKLSASIAVWRALASGSDVGQKIQSTVVAVMSEGEIVLQPSREPSQRRILVNLDDSSGYNTTHTHKDRVSHNLDLCIQGPRNRGQKDVGQVNGYKHRVVAHHQSRHRDHLLHARNGRESCIALNNQGTIDANDAAKKIRDLIVGDVGVCNNDCPSDDAYAT